MLVVLALLAGLVLAVPFVNAARRRSGRGALRIYAIGLVAAALIYVVFGIVGGASLRWLAVELAGVVLFGGAAWLAVKTRGRWLLAAAWAAHVLWDVLLHLGQSDGAAYTPSWYPWVCVSFDLVLAVASLRTPVSGEARPGS